MLKEYLVKVHLVGFYEIEDPQCPPSWRGSHCYDVTVRCWADIELAVWAESESEAEELAEEYDYELPQYTVSVEDVQVKGVRLVDEMPDLDTLEAGVIDLPDINWREPESEPDPDEYYDRIRDDRATS